MNTGNTKKENLGAVATAAQVDCKFAAKSAKVQRRGSGIRRAEHEPHHSSYTVTSGRETIGTIERCDATYAAFDINGRRIGAFGSLLEASRAIDDPNRTVAADAVARFDKGENTAPAS
jgi:hypothetical protein